MEETIVGPHFKALGEQPTFGDTKTHKELLDLMDVITKDTNVLAAAAAKVELEGIGHSKVTPATDQAVSAALEALRNSWTTFKDYMWIHLCEEEKAWPAIYKKVGGPVDAMMLPARCNMLIAAWRFRPGRPRSHRCNTCRDMRYCS